MDARIPKMRAEAAKLKARIDNLTERYTAMVDKITELENLEIIGLVRAETHKHRAACGAHKRR